MLCETSLIPFHSGLYLRIAGGEVVPTVAILQIIFKVPLNYCETLKNH